VHRLVKNGLFQETWQPWSNLQPLWDCQILRHYRYLGWYFNLRQGNELQQCHWHFRWPGSRGNREQPWL